MGVRRVVMFVSLWYAVYTMHSPPQALSWSAAFMSSGLFTADPCTFQRVLLLCAVTNLLQLGVCGQRRQLPDP